MQIPLLPSFRKHRHQPALLRSLCHHATVNALPAFSLIEVVIALGLVMSSLLVIFSIIPAGIGTLHSASRQVVETEIFSSIGAELNATPFTNLDQYVSDNFTDAPKYFDIEGRITTNTAEAIYYTRCTLTNDSTISTNELRRGTVKIGFNQDPNNTNTTNAVIHKRTFQISNRGQ